MNPELPDFLDEHFPMVDRIPDHIKLVNPVHERGILINGQILQSDGLSIWYIHRSMSSRQIMSAKPAYAIGSYPLGTATEVLTALNLAVNGFDAGRCI